MPDSPPSHDELVADARALAETLEAAHPEPYVGHGGRVQFHRRLAELVRSIPTDGEPVERFYWRLQRFAARVRDGHTQVRPPDALDAGPDGRFPLDFRVVGTALYVDAVYDASCTDLLGGRLLAVDGVAVDDLRERAARLESADNAYGDLVNLAETLASDSRDLAQLRDGSSVSPTVTVETRDGSTREVVLSAIDTDDPVATLDTKVERPETSGEPAYRFLDDDRTTVLLLLPDCHSHREVHEFAATVGGDVADFYDARDAYRRLVGEPVPDDPDEVVAGLPAMTEILTDLVSEMAAAGTETLVVDTRDNGGGSSMLAYFLTALLFGWDGVEEAIADTYAVPKDSALYRRKYGDDGPIGEPDNPAGFDFEDTFADAGTRLESTREQLCEYSETFAAAVESDELEGDYCPDEVLVVTSATTFSAGVEPAILLSKLGATVVGVPSAQAPNGPRDVLFEDLPNTGLEVRTSYRYHAFSPGEPGGVFVPNVELTPERFEALDAVDDAGVRLALEHVEDVAA